MSILTSSICSNTFSPHCRITFYISDCVRDDTSPTSLCVSRYTKTTINFSCPLTKLISSLPNRFTYSTLMGLIDSAINITIDQTSTLVNPLFLATLLTSLWITCQVIITAYLLVKPWRFARKVNILLKAFLQLLHLSCRGFTLKITFRFPIGKSLTKCP